MFHILLYYLEKPKPDYQLSSLEVPFSCILLAYFYFSHHSTWCLLVSQYFQNRTPGTQACTSSDTELKANVQAKQRYMQQYLNISHQPDQKYSVPLVAPGFNSNMCGTARGWVLFLVACQLKFTSIRAPTAFGIMQEISIRVK